MQRWLKMLGRIYFIAIIPFFAAAAGPWIFGSANNKELPVLLLWSFTVLVFVVASFVGALAQAGNKLIAGHLLVGMITVATALSALLLGVLGAFGFAATALLLVLHWTTLTWIKRSELWVTLDNNWQMQHNRFVWTIVACHMFVLLNVLYQMREQAQI